MTMLSAEPIRRVSADAGATAGPVDELVRDSESPAADDYLGTRQWIGKNNAGEDVIYGDIVGQIKGVSDGSESGDLVLRVMRAGTLTEWGRAKASGRFGLGTSDPAKKLEIVDGTGAAQARFTYDGSNYVDIGVSSLGNLSIDGTGSGTENVFFSNGSPALAASAERYLGIYGKDGSDNNCFGGIYISTYDQSSAGGSNKPCSALYLQSGDGQVYAIWVDDDGKLRIGTNTNLAGSTGGTIVGTQS